jgi:hypothetical protein
MSASLSLSSMRSGVLGVATKAASAAEPASGEKLGEVEWRCNETLVRLGLVQIVRSKEAADVGSAAETLALNIARLHGYQNAFKQKLVVATGLLIAKQGLITKLLSLFAGSPISDSCPIEDDH